MNNKTRDPFVFVSNIFLANIPQDDALALFRVYMSLTFSQRANMQMARNQPFGDVVLDYLAKSIWLPHPKEPLRPLSLFLSETTSLLS